MRFSAPLTPDLKTREHFVREMVRLSLWYVRRLLARGEITPGDLPRALTCRVNLYRLTLLWDEVHDPATGAAGPEWTRLCGRLSGLLLASPDGDTARLEEEGLAVLWPFLEPRLPLDVGPPRRRPHGCWSYELAWEGIGDRQGWLGKLSNPTHVSQRLRKVLGLPLAPRRDAALHFENAFIPRSPFAHMPELVRSLRALIGECRSQDPPVLTVWCDSWLNGHSAFQELFPRSWVRSATPRPPGNHYNWWGQLIDCTGAFNAAAAARFRASGGRFRYPARLCHAPLEAIDRHLDRLPLSS